MTALDNGHPLGGVPASTWEGHLAAPAPAPAAPVDEVQDFDAYWAAQQATRPRARIRGIVVQVPSDLPLSFEDSLRQLQDSERAQDVERLVGMVFGADILGRWRTAGMGTQEFKVVLAWGLANAAGKAVDFAEAADLVRKGEAEKAARQGAVPGPGKGPVGNRAARRKKARRGS